MRQKIPFTNSCIYTAGDTVMDSPCAATSGASVLAGGTDIKRMNSSTVYDSSKCFGAFIKMGLGQECREGPFASGTAGTEEG